MSNVRSMLARVARLERARTAPRSPFEHIYGSLDSFTEDVQAGIDLGTLDRIDMPIILTCIRAWHERGLFDMWQRDRIW